MALTKEQRRVRRCGLGVVLAACALGAGVASGITVAISGDTFNNSTDWKTFNTVRTKAGTGNVSLQLTNNVQCCRTLSIRLYFTQSGGVSVGAGWTNNDTNVTKNVATSVVNGTTFKLQARVSSGIPLIQDTTFGGNLTY